MSHFTTSGTLLLTLAALIGAVSPVAAEEDTPPRHHLGIGGFLAITAETVDSEEIVALNVLPLTVELAFHDRVGLRGRSLLNLDLLGSRGLLHLGGQIAMLGYVTAPGRARQGLYAGPTLGFARLPGGGNHDLIVAAELGYRWPIAEDFALDVCAQAGATRLSRGSSHTWTDHLGVYPGVTYWL